MLDRLSPDALELVGGHLAVRNLASAAQASTHVASALANQLAARRETAEAEFVGALDLASRLITRASLEGAEAVMQRVTSEWTHSADDLLDTLTARSPRFRLECDYGNPSSVFVDVHLGDSDAAMVDCRRPHGGQHVTARVHPSRIADIVRRALRLRLPKTYRVTVRHT